MHLICVPPAGVQQAWPKVSGLIFLACKKGTLGAFAPIERAVLGGFAQLWLAWDGKQILGAIVTEIWESEWRKDLVIIAGGGKGSEDVLALRKKLYDYARSLGCKSVRITVRPAFAERLPDFKSLRIVMEHKL